MRLSKLGETQKEKPSLTTQPPIATRHFAKNQARRIFALFYQHVILSLVKYRGNAAVSSKHVSRDCADSIATRLLLVWEFKK